jgi:hypothetical protein
MFLKDIFYVLLSTFAVNICLCSEYLLLQFVLLVVPPDPAGAKKKDRYHFKIIILLQSNYALPVRKKIFGKEKVH